MYILFNGKYLYPLAENKYRQTKSHLGRLPRRRDDSSHVTKHRICHSIANTRRLVTFTFACRRHIHTTVAMIIYTYFSFVRRVRTYFTC